MLFLHSTDYWFLYGRTAELEISNLNLGRPASQLKITVNIVIAARDNIHLPLRTFQLTQPRIPLWLNMVFKTEFTSSLIYDRLLDNSC